MTLYVDIFIITSGKWLIYSHSLDSDTLGDAVLVCERSDDILTDFLATNQFYIVFGFVLFKTALFQLLWLFLFSGIDNECCTENLTAYWVSDNRRGKVGFSCGGLGSVSEINPFNLVCMLLIIRLTTLFHVHRFSVVGSWSWVLIATNYWYYLDIRLGRLRKTTKGSATIIGNPEIKTGDRPNTSLNLNHHTTLLGVCILGWITNVYVRDEGWFVWRKQVNWVGKRLICLFRGVDAGGWSPTWMIVSFWWKGWCKGIKNSMSSSITASVTSRRGRFPVCTGG